MNFDKIEEDWNRILENKPALDQLLQELSVVHNESEHEGKKQPMLKGGLIYQLHQTDAQKAALEAAEIVCYMLKKNIDFYKNYDKKVEAMFKDVGSTLVESCDWEYAVTYVPKPRPVMKLPCGTLVLDMIHIPGVGECHECDMTTAITTAPGALIVGAQQCGKEIYKPLQNYAAKLNLQLEFPDKFWGKRVWDRYED